MHVTSLPGTRGSFRDPSGFRLQQAPVRDAFSWNWGSMLRAGFKGRCASVSELGSESATCKRIIVRQYAAGAPRTRSAAATSRKQFQFWP